MVKENDIAEAELLEYKHLAREKQVRLICVKLSQTLDSEAQSKAAELQDSAGALYTLGTIPPVEYDQAELDKAKLVIEHTSKITSMEDFMMELVGMSHVKSKSPQRLLLESDEPTSISFHDGVVINDRTLRLIFQNKMEMYRQAVENGKNNARSQMLGILEGNVPLQQWRRDIVQTKTNLMLTTNGGLKGQLPTKIPEVYVEYNYANEPRSMPQLAVLVYPVK